MSEPMSGCLKMNKWMDWNTFAQDNARGEPLMLFEGAYSRTGDGIGWGEDSWVEPYGN